ncbi:MAG: hypothetical protein KDC76_11495 [Bacteroidetes bacterium]|nr:hypothetical protein [Bacteroidota bacterium]
MKRITQILILLMLVQVACTVHPDKEIRPFAIQTHLIPAENRINVAFGMTDNSFGVLMDDPRNNGTLFYKYGADLVLKDSVLLAGIRYSAPAFDEDGNMIFLGFDPSNFNDVMATQVNNDLQVIQNKILNPVLPPGSGPKYNPVICRLTHGDYVIGYTLERPGIGKAYRMIFCCLSDVFSASQRKWEITPITSSGDWIETLSTSHDGGFYVAGRNRFDVDENFVIKFTSDGTKLWEDLFPFAGSSYGVLETNDFVYFADLLNLYQTDLNGNTVKTIEHTTGPYAAPVSSFIESNGKLFYVADRINPDGFFIEIRRLNTSLEQEKSIIRGSTGTNDVTFEKRHLIKLNNGKMIVLANVQTPSRFGSYWLVLPFNDELKLEGE